MISSKDISTHVKYHERLDTLSIYVFYEILNSREYSLLTISGEPTEEQLSGAWEKLFNTYFEKAGIKAPEWKDILKLGDLVHKYKCISGLLHIVCKLDGNFEDAVTALKKWNYHIRENEPLDDEIKRLYKGLESLKTKISILDSSIEKPKKQAKLNIWKEAIRLKKHFKFEINVKETTCIEWIELNNQFREDISRRNGKRSD